MDALVKLSAATTALAEARTLEEVKHIVDMAEAARTYARAAKLGLEAANYAAEVKLRAERKAGELLGQLERGKTGPKTELDDILSPNSSEYRTVLVENDIEPKTAQRWQMAAAVPEEIFEQHIAEMKEERKELTSASVLRLAQEHRREQMRQSMAEAPALPERKYRVFYADPPWRYNDAGVITDTDAYGRAERHYPTMSIEDLCDLGSKVRDVAANDGAYHAVEVKTNGIVTAIGFPVPVSHIEGLQEVLIPIGIYQKYRIETFMATGEMGRRATYIVAEMVKSNLIPLPISVNFADSKTMQISGTDIIVSGTLHIQVKCDFRGGDKRYNGATGNLFIQTEECNPYRSY